MREVLKRLCRLMLVLVLVSRAAAQDPQVVLYNWSEYMDPAILDQFYRETGIRVIEIHYQTDQSKEALLALNGGAGMDLMITSAIRLPDYARAGWIRPLTLGENELQRDPRWDEVVRQNGVLLGVPMLWGTVGILYRNDRVDEPRSWMTLYRPQPEYAGRFMLIDDVKDTFGLALKALGYSINSSDRDENLQAAALLQALTSFRPHFGYPRLDERNALSAGQIDLAMVYNGDAVILTELDHRLSYTVPDEGTNLWLDCLALLTRAPHPEAAMQFIQFMLRPDVGAKWSLFARYAPAQRNAEALLPAHVRANPVIYPPEAVRSRSEMFRPLPDSVLRLREATYARVRGTL